MKKILPILLCVLLTSGAGYKGSLPNIEAEFAHLNNKPQTAQPPFNPEDPSSTTQQNKPSLTPIPRNDKKYVEIIIKKDKSTQYINDTTEIINILEKLKTCMYTDNDIQHFNAIISNLIDNISAMQENYKGKPESNFISYKTLVALSNQARQVAILRTESQVYAKYLPYSTSGAVYKPAKIKAQINNLSTAVDQALYVLKNLD